MALKRKMNRSDWSKIAYRDPLRYALLSGMRRNKPIVQRHVKIRNWDIPVASPPVRPPRRRKNFNLSNILPQLQSTPKSISERTITPLRVKSENETPSTSNTGQGRSWRDRLSSLYDSVKSGAKSLSLSKKKSYNVSGTQTPRRSTRIRVRPKRYRSFLM